MQGVKLKRSGVAVSTGLGQVATMSWYRTMLGSGTLPLGWPSWLPWHWPQARLNTTLPAVSRMFSTRSGSGGGRTPAAIASANARTLGDENIAF